MKRYDAVDLPTGTTLWLDAGLDGTVLTGDVPGAVTPVASPAVPLPVPAAAGGSLTAGLYGAVSPLDPAAPPPPVNPAAKPGPGAAVPTGQDAGAIMAPAGPPSALVLPSSPAAGSQATTVGSPALDAGTADASPSSAPPNIPPDLTPGTSFTALASSNAAITPTVPINTTETTFIDGVNTNGTLATGTATSYWGYSGTTAHKWSGGAAGTAGGVVTYHFDAGSNWTATEESTFRECFALWQAIANVSFAESTSTSANTLITRGTSGANTSEPASAGSGSILGSPTGQATISLQTSVAGFDASGSFSLVGGYGVGTIVHEMGHLIGLGHAGPYNGAVNPATQQFGPQDDRLWSIMSYIYWGDTTAKYLSTYPVQGTNWGNTVDGYQHQNSTTWMPLDVIAAQQLYGAATNTVLSGGQIFGFHTNVDTSIRNFYDFTVNTAPVITLYDRGVNNTLDVSGYSTNSTIDLRDGHFSSFAGMVNNLGIAYGTKIDAAVGGAGNDIFETNGDADTIDGGAGSNAVLFAAARSAYVLARSGAAVTVTATATGVKDTLTNIQSLTFTDTTILTSTVTSTTSDDFNGDGKSDLLLQNTNGTIVFYGLNGPAVNATAFVNNPGPTWHVVGEADFNGDGKADILLQNDNGSIVDYLMNGTTVSALYTLSSPGSGWHVRGTADFNNDGKADILLQNDNGSMVLFDTNGSGVTAGVALGQLPVGWAIEGIGDFNGDGTPDVLVESNGGTLVDYTMNSAGTGFVAGSTIATVGAGWTVAGTADYNGDGKADILLHNDNGADVVFYQNGATVTGSTAFGNPGAAYQGAVTGIDINGDGTPDVVVQSTNSTLVGFQLGSNAAITSAAVLNVPGAGWTLAGGNPTTFIDGTGSTLALTATPGPDQFNLTSYGVGVHTLASFDAAQDTVALSAAAFASYAAVQANEVAYQGGTFINLSPSAAIVIQGVTPGQLTAANFVLR